MSTTFQLPTGVDIPDVCAKMDAVLHEALAAADPEARVKIGLWIFACLHIANLTRAFQEVDELPRMNEFMTKALYTANIKHHQTMFQDMCMQRVEAVIGAWFEELRREQGFKP